MGSSQAETTTRCEQRFDIIAHISNWLAVNRGCGALINGSINYKRLLPGVEWANIYHSYNLKDRLSRYLLQS